LPPEPYLEIFVASKEGHYLSEYVLKTEKKLFTAATTDQQKYIPKLEVLT
jgi:hypothetical protein